MKLIALIAGLLSGVIGAMGLGGGAVLIIYLAVFAHTEQLTAQGINLLFFLPIGALAVIVYAKHGEIKWKKTLLIAAGGLIGALLGLLVAGVLGGKLTAKLFGALLIALGIKEVFSKKRSGEK